MALRTWASEAPIDSFRAAVYEHVRKAADEMRCHLFTEFTTLFGGDIFVCVEFSDLNSIATCATDEGETRWLSIVEHADSFDAAEWLSGGYGVFIMLCTNNDGGNSYYVPRDLVIACTNIQESINLTKEAWKGTNVN